MALRLDGYVRVSSVAGRSGEGYISPPDQREAIEAYARELDGEIVAWHDDQDYSGGTVERPGFQHCLERLRAGESDGIVVMRTDRFARTVPEGAAIVREIVERGQVFASCLERFDPRTDIGRYLLNDFLNNAELLLNQTKSGWVRAKTRANARKAHIGPTPIGYLKVEPLPTKPTHISPADSQALGGPTESGRLVPCPTYGPAIMELFERAAAKKYGDSELARWMTERAPRRTGMPWQGSEIRRWLKNRIYLGGVQYGELDTPDAHEPLTDPETWERCQRDPGKQRRTDSPFLLSGLIRCAHCRYAMAGNAGGGRDRKTAIYRCTRTKAGECGEGPVITARPLEDYIRGLVVEHLRGLELEAASAGVDLATLDREYDDAEREVRRFGADANAHLILGEEGWQEGLAERGRVRDAKREARAAAYAQSRVGTVAPRGVDDLDHEGLRDLLLGMIRHIFIRRQPRGTPTHDRVLVIWSDDTRDIDVPGPHRSGPFEPIWW